MWLYLFILIGSISIPISLSFDKKLHFYKQWRFLFPAIVGVALVYIACDIIFTKLEVWGFNPNYHLNMILFNLPIEEWLFFIVIPYSSIFLHEAFILYFPHIKLGNKLTRILTLVFILLLFIVVAFNWQKTYTVYIFSLLIIALIVSLIDKTNILNSYYLTFLIMLIPFFVVNSILTGSFIENEVVWYDTNENLGFRIFTIPIEDFGYGFSLILFNLLFFNKLKRNSTTKPKH